MTTRLFLVPAAYASITHIRRDGADDVALCGWKSPSGRYGVTTMPPRQTVCAMCLGHAERAELTTRA